MTTTDRRRDRASSLMEYQRHMYELHIAWTLEHHFEDAITTPPYPDPNTPSIEALGAQHAEKSQITYYVEHEEAQQERCS